MSFFPITPTLFPPNGIDRASGLDGLPGTQTQDGQVLVTNVFGQDIPSNAFFFEEFPDSPTIERAEQATITHRFSCDETTGTTLIESYSRGVIVMDSLGNVTRVLSATLQWTKGQHCILTIVAEGISFDPPPDLFGIEIVELNPAAEKHPRYTELTYQERYQIRNAGIADSSDLNDQYQSIINTYPGGPKATPPVTNPNLHQRTEYNEGKELLLKLHKGEDSFYLPGYKVSFSQYFYAPVTLNPGGYIEDPIGSGNLPYFFWSINGSANPGGQFAPGLFSNSWFAVLLKVNPSIYAHGLSWLRLADTVEYERTWFKVTRSWQGGPLGNWDNEWYNITNEQIGQNTVVQPYQISDSAKAVVLTGA